MKNPILLFLIFHFFSGNSQAPFNWVNTGGPDGSLQSYILANDNYAFIPEYDYLYRTADGIHWESMEHIVSDRVSVYKDTLVNILFDKDPSSGHLQLSYDNGSTWVMKEIPNAIDNNYGYIVMCSHGIYIYIISTNLLYLSTDLGDTWKLLSHQGIRGTSIFAFDNRLYISDEQFLARTDTTGENWEVITPSLMQSHIIADVVASGPHLLVQTTGTGNDLLFHSHNDAQSWESVPMKGGSTNDWIQQAGNAIYAFSDEHFLISENFGESWDTLQKVNITLAPNYFAGLRDTFLFTTFDSGVFRWDKSTHAIEESNIGLSKGYIYDLCSSGDKIWASTGNGIYAYSRQSKTWTWTAPLPDPDLDYNFIVTNEDGLLVLADQMQVDFYISEDGGYTWQAKSIPGDFLGVFWIELIGDYIYVLTDFEVIRSPDKGETWDYLFSEDYIISGITKFNDRYYMASTDRLYTSADDGESWQSIDMPYPIYGLGAYKDELFAVARNNGDAELYISLDGISWRYAGDGFPQDYPTDIFFRHKPLFYRDAGHYYVFNVGIGYQIYTSPVDSIYWNIMPFTKPLQIAEHPYDCVFEDELIYLGGQGVYSTIIENPLSTMLYDPAGQVNVQFSIFPNPAFEYLDVTMSESSSEGGCVYALYNTNGILLKSQSGLSTETIRFAVQDIPPGIYFLQAITSEGAGVVKVVKN